MIWPLQLLVSAGVAALLAVSAYAGAGVAALAVGAVAVGLALGWPVLLRLPHAQGSRLVVALSGIAGAVVVGLPDLREHPMTALVALVALSVPLAFVHELARRDGRPRVVESVTGTFSGQLLALLACGWALVPATRAEAGAVVVGATAVVATRLSGALRLKPNPTAWVGLALGVVASAAVSTRVSELDLRWGALTGLAVGAIVALADRLLTAEGMRGLAGVGLLSAALAPIAAAGTAVFAVARLATGG